MFSRFVFTFVPDLLSATILRWGPSDSEYVSSASIVKGLDHLLVLPCCSPSLTAIQQNCFHVGIETIGFVFTLNMGLINKVDMVCLSPVGYGV